MAKKKYDVVLAVAGSAVALLFALAALALVYAAAHLVSGGGFLATLAGIALAVPAAWSAYIAVGLAYKTAVRQ